MKKKIIFNDQQQLWSAEEIHSLKNATKKGSSDTLVTANDPLKQATLTKTNGAHIECR